MKNILTLAAISALAISPCIAEADTTPFAEYLERSKQSLVIGDTHNAEIYEKLALMKREADADPSYDWSDFHAIKAKLKDRSNKAFSKKAVQFFQSSSNSDETRVCYVIDFSASMKGKREELLRKELTHSIGKLPEDTEFSAFFFAGPVWQPGDSVARVNRSKEHVIVTHNDVETIWKGRGAHSWTANQAPPAAQWQLATHDIKTQITQQIKDQQLVWGTDWASPLETALNQDPLPNVIYFMTDGSCSTANQSAKTMAALAKEKGVRINSIAMMEPKAEKPMQYIAAQTGGDFVIITPDGKCKLHEAGCIETPDLDNQQQRMHKKDRKKSTKKHSKKSKK